MLTEAPPLPPLPGPLAFDADTHTYRVGTQVWPSVTEILQATGVARRWSEMPPSARAHAEFKRDLGSRVHRACALLDLGTLSWASVDDAAFGYVEAWEKYLSERSLGPWELIEEPIAHPLFGYAGTPDRYRDGLLVDIKTGDPDDAAGRYQTSAYAALVYARTGVTVGERECVRLYGDGHYVIEPYKKHNEDAKRWLAILSTFNCQPERNRP